MSMNYIIVGSSGEVRYAPSVAADAEFVAEAHLGGAVVEIGTPPHIDGVTGELVVRLTPEEVPLAVADTVGYVVFTWGASGITRRDRVTFLVLDDDPTEVETVDVLKLMINLPSAPASLVLQMAADAEEEFRTITHLATVPEAAEPLVRKLVVAAYNALGSEGLSSESYSGTSQSFIGDLDDRTKREVYAFRRVGW